MDAICQKHSSMIGPAVCLHCEIESLRRRLQDGSPIHEAVVQHMAMEIAALKKERDDLKAYAAGLEESLLESDKTAVELAALKRELAECKRERNDALRASMNDMNQLGACRKERDELAAACRTFCEWLDREEAGWIKAGNKRDTPEDERKWRKWYDENLRLCSLAQERARAALAKVGADKTGEV